MTLVNSKANIFEVIFLRVGSNVAQNGLYQNMQNVVKDDLERLIVLLPSPLECWEQRHVPLYPQAFVRLQFGAL